MPRERMEDFQRYLVETGVLPKEIDVSNYYTEDLIPEINAFDRPPSRRWPNPTLQNSGTPKGHR